MPNPDPAVADVAITYNNQVIGELTDSGTVRLTTANKCCISDIEVEYTKPESAGSAIEVPVYFDNNLGSPVLLTTITARPGTMVDPISLEDVSSDIEDLVANLDCTSMFSEVRVRGFSVPGYYADMSTPKTYNITCLPLPSAYSIQVGQQTVPCDCIVIGPTPGR